MSFYYSLSFVFRTEPLEAIDLAAAEYVTGRRKDLPTTLPDAPCFSQDPPYRFLDPAAAPDPLDVYRHISMTDLESYRSRFGHRFVLAVEGVDLPVMIACCMFVDWLARFVNDDGPVGTVFSPDMPDAAPRAFFIRNRRLFYGDMQCEEQPLTQ